MITAIKKPNNLIMKATMRAARVMRETLSWSRWGARGRVRLSTLRRQVTATNPQYLDAGVTTSPVTGSVTCWHVLPRQVRHGVAGQRQGEAGQAPARVGR